MALVWKLPELETQRVGGNKIYTLVYKLDPGTAAGFSALRVLSVCPSVARAQCQCRREAGEEDKL